jgi:hypothetical protein
MRYPHLILTALVLATMGCNNLPSDPSIVPQESLSMSINEIVNLTVGEGHSIDDLAFSSTNPEVATIDDNGRIRCLDTGACTIEVTDGTGWDYVSIAVDSHIVLACCLRRVGPDPWYIIDDQAHTPMGVVSIEETSESLTLFFSFTASEIHTFVVTPDETFAEWGYFCGASVGNSDARIKISEWNEGEVTLVDPTTIDSDRGNLWVYGVFSK